jgi:hypothetical protein
MAQLNYYTYLSQVTSLIIIYLIYFCINKQILIPTIVEKIKIKNYILNQISNISTKISHSIHPTKIQLNPTSYTLDHRSKVSRIEELDNEIVIKDRIDQNINIKLIISSFKYYIKIIN